MTGARSSNFKNVNMCFGMAPQRVEDEDVVCLPFCAWDAVKDNHVPLRAYTRRPATKIVFSTPGGYLRAYACRLPTRIAVFSVFCF